MNISIDGNDVDIFDTLSGFFAYDTGSIDSGIKNDSLRERIKKGFDIDEFGDTNMILSKFMKWLCFENEESMKDYGIECAKEIFDWLSMEMDIDY